MKKEIIRLNKIIEEMESRLLLISEMYYDDRESNDIKNWIKELKEIR